MTHPEVRETTRRAVAVARASGALISLQQLTAMLRFANAAAYLVTTKKGAIRSMPEPEQVQAILANH